jgi:hypothetical protein
MEFAGFVETPIYIEDNVTYCQLEIIWKEC